MTWKSISLIEEMRLRIQKAIDDGDFDCRDIFVGDFEQIRHGVDLPILIMAPSTIKPVSRSMPHGIRDENTIRIAYFVNKLSDNNNKLYNTDDLLGVLYEIPKLLNYLEKRRSDGTCEITMEATCESLPDPTITFDYSQNNRIGVILTYNLNTIEYDRSER